MARLRVQPRSYRLPGGFFVIVKMPTGVRYTIDVVGQDTVRKLKRSVSMKVGRNERTFDLSLGPKLLDEEMSLDDLEIIPETVLIFVDKVSPVRIILQIPTGNRSVEVPSNSKVRELRERIVKLCKIPQFDIIFNGAILEDDQVLDEIDVVNNSTVTLAITTNGGLSSRRD